MEAIHLQKTLEIKKGEFELINGKFSPDDAMEILGNLIQKKIDYHSLRSFSHYERFGVTDQWSDKRLKELKKSFESIQVIIEKAREHGNYLDISSSISIEVVPLKQTL